MKYEFKEIEKKWQDEWESNGVFHAKNDYSLPKYYALVEFPYPSGQGLHVGHPRSYTALDIVARKKRMQGYNVLYPMGWDAFGLPTENFAIKTGIHPKTVTHNNIARFKKQLMSLGLSFDWSREINTTDESYYKWTQWIFIQLFKHGLAYKTKMAVNWCTSCKCVLANEEVVGGVCERCGSEVIRREKSQWMLRITAYAQRLIDDLSLVDFIDRVNVQQKNWIGRSEGAEVDFATTAGENLRVYTTRPDTLFGATYMVIAPEHPDSQEQSTWYMGLGTDIDTGLPMSLSLNVYAKYQWQNYGASNENEWDGYRFKVKYFVPLTDLWGGSLSYIGFTNFDWGSDLGDDNFYDLNGKHARTSNSIASSHILALNYAHWHYSIVARYFHNGGQWADDAKLNFGDGPFSVRSTGWGGYFVVGYNF